MVFVFKCMMHRTRLTLTGCKPGLRTKTGAGRVGLQMVRRFMLASIFTEYTPSPAMYKIETYICHQWFEDSMLQHYTWEHT